MGTVNAELITASLRFAEAGSRKAKAFACVGDWPMRNHDDCRMFLLFTTQEDAVTIEQM